MMKKSFHFLAVALAILTIATACNHAAKTPSSTDSVVTDSAQHDGTLVDTQKIDTTHHNDSNIQGEGHRLGSMD